MNINKYLLFFAHLVKNLHLPHVLKYLFFLIIRNRNIEIKSTLKSGAKVNVNLGEFIGFWIYMDGSYEDLWIQQVAKLVKNKTFIDIGANIGAYSLSLFKVAKQIHAVEPVSVSYNSLMRDIKANRANNISAYKISISDTDKGEVPIFINSTNKGLSSLKIHYSEGKEMVKSITLDTFIKRNHISNIGLIKIDVEGSELDVLKGATQTLKFVGPPILIELNGKILKLAHHTPIELYKVLTKHGYRAHMLTGGSLTKFDVTNISSNMNCNVLFTK